MILFSVELSAITLPIGGDDFENIHSLSARLLEETLRELDTILGNELWCFIPRMVVRLDPDPEIIINIEVNDDYYYTDISADVTDTFKRNLARLTKSNRRI